ncbi:type II toxin-antitoxin system VapC family toxin [Luteimonas marina]|uniref:Ribonuclease VapC n=1 Tax=Luteimonas marina TaxID=488485 RepID=A0A5C5U640_9GAMM|nr:type II toxin-antitoxin system VapC family toxin [Luteimonas marina]TWT21082.1 type II toxin-antitoxin system VapC family toxin [Luteimonas marina]
MPFVLDNSVVSGWLLKRQGTAYADTVARRLQEGRAVVPPLLRHEYANVLRTACKLGRLTAQQAQDAIADLATLPLDIDQDVPDAGQLLALALRYDLTSYDATYLDLALRRQLPIATQDAALAQAARLAGVGVVEP